MRRGEIYWAELSPRTDSEPSGRRPVVIVSRDALNRVPGWRSVNVVPSSTSQTQARRGLTTAHLLKDEGRLTQDSVALCHQVTALDRGKLRQLIGSLDRASMTRIEEAIKIALELE